MGDAQPSRSTMSNQPMVDFFSWLKYAATRPYNIADDPSPPDLTPDSSYFQLALSFREFSNAKLLLPWTVDSSSRKRQKVHPFIYEDESEITSRMNRTLRSSNRILSPKKKLLLSNSSTGSTDPDEESEEDFRESISNGSYHLVRKYPSRGRKNIRVGPRYQAQCPDWRARDSESEKDPNTEKFLGQRIWPRGKTDRRSTLRLTSVKCFCLRPNSMECAKLHIKERRLNLRRELGSAFTLLGFDDMGEEVSNSWSSVEEDEFMDTARMSESSQKTSLWDQVFLAFPSKSRRDMVSYYFNVFILRRRAYQNRVTMDFATSDDEEEDSMSLECVENTQCIDID